MCYQLWNTMKSAWNHPQIDSDQPNAAPLIFMPVLAHVFAQDWRLIVVVVLPVAVSRSFKSLQHHGKLCTYNSTQFPLVRREVNVGVKLDGVDERTCCLHQSYSLEDYWQTTWSIPGSPSISCFLVLHRNEKYKDGLSSIMKNNCPASLQVAWFQLQHLPFCLKYI